MAKGNRRHVLVTGASTGIGRSSALLLARHGFDVFASVRREEDADSLAAEGQANLTSVPLDVTDPTSVAAAAKIIEAGVGSAGLYGLVNNAGVSCGGPLEYVDLEAFRGCFEVNVFGALAVTRALLPMLRGAGGRIVNMSSGVGRVAPPLVGPYAASKFALEAISDSLRVELRRSGIAVSIVEPGFVDTPLLGKGNEQTDAERENLPDGAPEYYRGAMLKLRSTFDQGRPIGADVVAKTVLRALTTARPRTRYIVGTDAKALISLRRLLSDRLLDKVLGKMVDL